VVDVIISEHILDCFVPRKDVDEAMTDCRTPLPITSYTLYTLCPRRLLGHFVNRRLY